MSGDTPTADGIPHSLDCPDCSSAAFARAVAHWTDGESEHCPGCGSSLRVSLEEHDGDPDELTAVVVSYEHGGEVVARLLADTGRLSDQLTQDENDRKECEAGAIERDRMRKEFAATIERLTEERDAIWAERVELGKVAARAGREAAELRGRVAVLEAQLASTAEPGNAEYIAWSDAGMPPPAPGHGEPVCDHNGKWVIRDGRLSCLRCGFDEPGGEQ